MNQILKKTPMKRSEIPRNKMVRRALALLMTCSLLISMVPSLALAEDGGISTSYTNEDSAATEPHSSDRGGSGDSAAGEEQGENVPDIDGDSDGTVDESNDGDQGKTDSEKPEADSDPEQAGTEKPEGDNDQEQAGTENPDADTTDQKEPSEETEKPGTEAEKPAGETTEDMDSAELPDKLPAGETVTTEGATTTDGAVTEEEEILEQIPEVPQRFTITFDGNGGVEKSRAALLQQKDAAADSIVTLPENVYQKEGCVFEGWNDGGETYAAGESYTMPARNVTFMAQWTREAVNTISLQINGGNETGGESLEAAVTAALNGDGLNNIESLIITSGIVTEGDWDWFASKNEEMPGLTEFTVRSGITSVSDIPDAEGDRVFPDSIERVSIAKVEHIGMRALADCSQLVSVEFPHAVSIGDYAFTNAFSSNVESTIHCPMVQTIGEGAFLGAGLTRAVFPCVDEIGFMAFYCCEYFCELSISAEPPTVGEDAFGFGIEGEKRLRYVDNSGKSLEGSELSKAQAAYDGDPADSNAGDGLWYGWSVGTPVEVPEMDVEVYITTEGQEQEQRCVGQTLIDALGGADSILRIKTVRVVKGTITAADWGWIQDRVTRQVCMNNLTEFTVEDEAIAEDIVPPASKYSKYPVFPKTLTSVSIPMVKSIGNSVFSGCVNLTSVDLPDVINLGDSVFSDCTSLKTVDLPNVIRMGDSVFRRCSSLKTVNIPKTETMGTYVFSDCTSLKSINWSQKLSMGKATFYGCTGLTDVSIPQLTVLENNVFFGCSSLEQVTLPMMTRIGEYAFQNCTALKQVDFPKVTTIGRTAFAASGLTSARFPKVKEIPNELFLNCQSLITVDFPQAVSVGTQAFQCPSLAEALIPELTSVGKFAFQDSGLIKADFPKVTQTSEGAFAKNKKLKEINFPKLTVISKSAFAECNALEVARFPLAASIEEYAFQRDENLNLYLGAAPPAVMGAYSFYTIPKEVVLTDEHGVALTGEKLAAAKLAYDNDPKDTKGKLDDGKWYGWKLKDSVLVGLAGVVKDANGNPVSGAQVTLTPSVGTTTQTTGKDGTYNFENIPEGSYTVTVVLPDETTMTQIVTAPVGEGGSGDIQLPFVAVTGLLDLPSAAKAGTNLTLTATVDPAGASNRTIIWSVKDAGGTGATISGGKVFRASSPGKAVITATISNGIAAGSDYSKDIAITVMPGDVKVNLTGKIMDADGEPCPGAKVSLLPNVGAGISITDADGYYIFTGIPTGSYTVVVEFPDGSRTTTTVTVKPDGSVTGSTVITQNSPKITIIQQPEDAEVTEATAGDLKVDFSVVAETSFNTTLLSYRWYRMRGKTPNPDVDEDTQGKNSVLHVPQRDFPAGEYMFYCVVSCDQAKSVITRVASMTVKRVTTVGGTVTDENGNVISDATVTITNSGNPEKTYGPATTGTNGTWQIPGVPDGIYDVTVTLPGGGSITEKVTIPSATGGDVTVELKKPEAAVIYITAQPKPVTVLQNKAVKLSISAASSDGKTLTYQWYKNTVNSLRGGTVIQGAVNTNYIANTAEAGTSYYYCRISAEGAAAVNSAVVRVTVRRTAVIDGTVKDKDGKPVADAGIVIVNPKDKGENYGPATSGSDGKWQLADVPEGTWQVIVTLPDGTVVTETITVTSEGKVNGNTEVKPPAVPVITINMQPQSITAVLRDTAKLEITATVSGSDPITYQWYRAVTNNSTDGKMIKGATDKIYFAPTDTKGTLYYYCAVSSRGAETKLTRVAAVTVCNTVTGTEVSGVVKDSSGTPVNQAKVTLTEIGNSANSQTTKTDSSGEYSFSNVPDGKYTIVVTLPDGSTITGKVTVEDGTVTGDTTGGKNPGDIQQPAEIAVTILSQPEDIAVAAGTEVQLKINASASSGETAYQWYQCSGSNGNGAKIINGAKGAALRPDTQVIGMCYYYCEVWPEGKDYGFTTSRIAAVTVLKEEPVTGDLTGSITDGVTNQGLAGVKVKVMKGGTEGLQYGNTVTTENDGAFEFQKLPYGTYSLVATKGDGEQTITKLIDITEPEVSESIVMPAGNKNTKVEVRGDAPSVASDSLTELFTPEDDAAAEKPQARVEIKLVVSKKAEAPEDEKEEIAKALSAVSENANVGLYLDAKLLKTISGAGKANVSNEPIQPPTGQTVRIVLDVPAEMQDKAPYSIIRMHEGSAATFSAVYNKELHTLTFEADLFSTYAIVYTEGSGTGGQTGGNSGHGSGHNSGGSSTAGKPDVSTPGHGTVTVNPVNPKPGETVTIIPKPEQGYEINKVIVKDKDGNKLELTDKGDGSYSFIQPKEAVSITANFVKTVNQAAWNPFSDVTEEQWFYDSVRYAYERGWMKGISETSFDPEGRTVTRSMIAAILWRMEGEPQVDEVVPFSDVARNTWYHDAVSWAAQEGIVKGYGDSTFAPEKIINRQEMAVMLYQYTQWQGKTANGGGATLDQYQDQKETSFWAKTALEWAVEQGLISGVNSQTLHPRGALTRAQVAAILCQYEINCNRQS